MKIGQISLALGHIVLGFDILGNFNCILDIWKLCCKKLGLLKIQETTDFCLFLLIGSQLTHVQNAVRLPSAGGDSNVEFSKFLLCSLSVHFTLATQSMSWDLGSGLYSSSRFKPLAMLLGCVLYLDTWG